MSSRSGVHYASQTGTKYSLYPLSQRIPTLKSLLKNNSIQKYKIKLWLINLHMKMLRRRHDPIGSLTLYGNRTRSSSALWCFPESCPRDWYPLLKRSFFPEVHHAFLLLEIVENTDALTHTITSGASWHVALSLTRPRPVWYLIESRFADIHDRPSQEFCLDCLCLT